MSDRVKIKWRAPLCGGFSVHGSIHCVPIEEAGGEIECHCVSKPVNFNYEIHHLIPISVFGKRMHLDKNCERWEVFCGQLFSDTGTLKKYEPMQGKTLKDRFFNTMIEECSKRHGVGKYAIGREAHPDLTPYDSIMLKMIKEMEDAEARKKAEKGKLK